MDVLAKRLPVRVGVVEVALERAPSPIDGGVRFEVRLVVLEDGAIRDLKAQELTVRGAPERVEAFLEAWTRVLPTWLETMAEPETMMPHDFFFAEALENHRLATVDDFVAVLKPDAPQLAAWREAREHEDFRALVSSCGLDAHLEALESLARPSLRIDTVWHLPPLQVGASKFGGLPDLPASLAWPEWEGTPAGFIGQLDCAAMHEVSDTIAAPLPAKGHLFFFAWQAGGGPAYDDELGRGGGRVLFSEDAPARRVCPPGLEAFPERRVDFTPMGRELPPLDSPYYATLVGDRDEAFETFGELASLGRFTAPLGSEYEERPAQRVLGYADPLQSSPNIDTEARASGLPPAQWESPETVRRACDWQLLLQADSEPDEEPRVLYGDGGVLCFLIRRDDLAARRFDLAWLDWQSH